MTSYPEFVRPAPLSLDTRSHQMFDEEEASVLDESILDGSLDSAEIFGEFAEPDAISSSSSNPFYKNNPFQFNQQVNSWTSGSCTPTTVYEAFPMDQYNRDASTSYTAAPGSMAAPAAFDPISSASTGQMAAFPNASTTGMSMPPSPHADKEWSPSGRAEQSESPTFPKIGRPGSPLRSRSPLMRRGDGIRKKNARFEIPAERNLHNIDQFIAQSSDDQEIKELKQQKRLLRNRQAALDSRQRKKQHTERLEEEKKTYTTIISELEERVAELEIRDAEHLRIEDELKATQQRYEHYIESLHLEKEEMVRSHTLETGDLRKKNAFLTEHIQKMESTAMSTVPSSSGFSADFSDLDSIAMEGNAWGNFSFLNDFSLESEVKPERSLVLPARKADKGNVGEADKPATSGLLLILLLCGAFVTSKSSTTSTPSIPRMPDDIIAASATVLDNIFKEAGVQQSDARVVASNRVQSVDSSPSDGTWLASKTSQTPQSMVGLSGSSLGTMSHQLLRPTKEQEQEQLFSLSVDQYNGVTSQEFLREPEPSGVSQGRRNLGASLAAMRDEHQASAAEVYTRSLLWDTVPAEVVREFAKFVSDSNAQNGD